MRSRASKRNATVAGSAQAGRSHRRDISRPVANLTAPERLDGGVRLRLGGAAVNNGRRDSRYAELASDTVGTVAGPAKDDALTVRTQDVRRRRRLRAGVDRPEVVRRAVDLVGG